MQIGSNLEAQFRKSQKRLDLTMRLSKSSLWEYVLQGPSVADSYIVPDDYLFAEGFEPATLTSFASSLELVGMWPEDHEPLTRAIQACVDGITPEFQVEIRSRDANGTTHWRLARGVVSRAHDGTATGFTGVGLDITDLKRAEAETRTVKERLEQAVRGSQVSVWDYELVGGTLSSSFFDFYNVWGEHAHAAEAQGADYAYFINSMIAAEHRAGVANAFDACIRGETASFQAEYRALGYEDGIDHWRLARGTVVRDIDGTPVRFAGTSIDITNLKHAEERFGAMFENAAVGIAVMDLDGRLLEYNDRLCEFLGYSRDELRNRSMAEFWVPERDNPDGDGGRRQITTSSAPLSRDRRYRRKDGLSVWGNDSTSGIQHEPNGNPTRLMLILQDVSARKGLEEDLQRTKDRLELGVRSSNLSIFEFDMPDGNFATSRQTLINFWELLGYELADAPGSFAEAAGKVLPEADQTRVYEEIMSYLTGESALFELEHQVRHKDGSIQWRLARGMALRNHAGTPIRFIGSHVDITDKKRVEERLRESEQRWRSLAETLPQFVFTTTADGLADYFSPRTMAYTGLSEPELLSWGWAAAIHPDDRERTAATWRENLEHQRSHQVEHRVRRADGEYRWFTTRAAAVWDSAGRVVNWFGTCTDIETLKRLEEELRHAKDRLELAIRSSNLSIWEYDMPDGTLGGSRETLTNVWESLGYETGVDAPESLSLVVHPDDVERSRAQRLAYLNGETKVFENEHRIQHKDGAYRWFLARGVAVRDSEGRAVRFVGTSVDITDIKRIELELQTAREAAEAANRAKDDFLANVSHEIRTPMNAILGMTELALDSARSAHQKQLLATVKSATRNLLGIINDLLDFSKIAAGKLVLDQDHFSLRWAIEDTVRALTARAHRKRLQLICQVHPEVSDALFGDAGRLRQVILNLVGNAIKFTMQGQIVVEVENAASDTTDGGSVLLCFKVRDTGIGIALEKQSAIFRAFEQEDSSTTRKYGGTGLGLTISAQLVALMGGEITVESEPGVGSTFGFSARFKRSSLRGSRLLSRAPERFEDLRVLIVDRDDANRAVIEEWLSNWRMRPTATADRAAALDALELAEARRRPYSLVLLGDRPPDIDAMSLAEEIRGRFSGCRIILLSAAHGRALIARGEQAGIAAQLLEPVDGSELLETIWSVMSSSGDEDTALENAERLAEAGVDRVTPVGPTTALHILVAEDNELNAALLRELLLIGGHRVTFATDGRIAMTLAMSGAFDLVLLDLHMPEMDGFEVVKAVRESEGTTGKHLPIVALTARSSKRDRERCLAAGMDDFLPKPIEADALLEAIQRMVTVFPPAKTQSLRLLDLAAILRGCNGREGVFEKLREVFQRSLPDHLTQAKVAQTAGDLPRLKEAAHLLSGTLSAFSTVAGELALALEQSAVHGDLESCEALVSRLDAMCSELLEDTRTLTLESLQS
jgi:two-component system, sensor histidine kinase and response regulator